MKLTLTTVYDNIDEEWFDWYVARLAKSGSPELVQVTKMLKKTKVVCFSSSDPIDKNITATTTYRLEDE